MAAGGSHRRPGGTRAPEARHATRELAERAVHEPAERAVREPADVDHATGEPSGEPSEVRRAASGPSPAVGAVGAPPSGLRAALAREADKQALVNWVFSRVADRYDLGNDIMSAGWHTRWKRRAVEMAEIRPHHRVLDLACGTGDVTWMLAERAWDGEIVGVDINEDMLRLAEPKRPRGWKHVRFEIADAAALPFPDASFDRVTCVYAGRGFPDFPAVLQEVWRVLKPGGRFLNLDFARPPNRTWDRLYRGWMTVSGAALGLALHGHPKTYVYIPVSMRHYAGQRWLEERMRQVGFEARTYETLGCLMAFNVGHKPDDEPSDPEEPGPDRAA